MKFKIPVSLNGLNVEHYLYNMLLKAYPTWDESEIGCMKEFIENNLIELVEPGDTDEDYDNVMNLLAYWRRYKTGKCNLLVQAVYSGEYEN